jgi:hypothetical protein
MQTKTLYRPVGLEELSLIYDLDLRGFPPRLPDQPIFYPVTNRAYAVQIARDWNAPSDLSGYAGFVTRFELDYDYVAKFTEQQVGDRMHKELWVPAEELAEFNTRIVGHLSLTDSFFDECYEGYVPGQFGLKGKNAVEQFVCLAKNVRI